MPNELWAHQREGLQKIIEHDGVHGLLWGMGAGKSRVAIAYVEHMVEEDPTSRCVLICCPKSVARTWHEQLAEHCTTSYHAETLDGTIPQRLLRLAEMGEGHPTKKLTVAIVTYPTFSSRKKVGSQTMADKTLAAVKKFAPGLIICDEAHALRSPTSNISKLFARITAAGIAPRRLLLTGTPMPSSPLDVLGQWAYLDPSAFAPPGTSKIVSKTRFIQAYAAATDQYGNVQSWKDLDDLNERVSRRSSAVRTEDCIDLPELRVITHKFELSPAEQKAYREMQRDLLTVVQDKALTAQNKLVSILRLRQVTSGFLPDEDGNVVQIGRTRHDIAVEMVENTLASDDRTVVFAWSRPELDRLYETLWNSPPFGARVVRIAGDTSQVSRDTVLAAFKDRPDKMVLLAQISSLNSGVNSLVRAHNVVYLSLTQRRDEFEQSLARFHRPGQRHPVVAHVVVGAGTVDERILEVFEGKARMEDALIDHIQSIASS